MLYRASARHPWCCQAVQVLAKLHARRALTCHAKIVLAMPARSKIEGNQIRTASPRLSELPHCNPSIPSITCRVHWTDRQDSHAQSAGSMTVPVCHCAEDDVTSCQPVDCLCCKLAADAPGLLCKFSLLTCNKAEHGMPNAGLPCRQLCPHVPVPAASCIAFLGNGQLLTDAVALSSMLHSPLATPKHLHLRASCKLG